MTVAWTMRGLRRGCWALLAAAACSAVVGQAGASEYLALDLTGNCMYDSSVVLLNASPVLHAATLSPMSGAAPLTYEVEPGKAVLVPMEGMTNLQTGRGLGGVYLVQADEALRVMITNGPDDENYCSDSTRLLADHELGTSYVIEDIGNHGMGDGYMPFFTVVAPDATTVTLHIKAKSADGGMMVGSTAAGGSVPKMFNGFSYDYDLARGEQLTVFPGRDGFSLTTMSEQGTPFDLSGTTITSGKPVAVFFGDIDLDGDPYFEQLLPTSAWGTEYVACTTYGQNFNLGGYTHDSRYAAPTDFLRIVAGPGGADVTFDPPPWAVPWGGVTLAAGAAAEFNMTRDVHVASSAPIAVYQYYAGDRFYHNADSILLEPRSSWAASMPLFTEASRPGWQGAETDPYNSVIGIAVAPGAAVSLDAKLLPPGRPVGASGYSCAFAQGTGGVHLAYGNATAWVVGKSGGTWSTINWPGAEPIVPKVVHAATPPPPPAPGTPPAGPEGSSGTAAAPAAPQFNSTATNPEAGRAATAKAAGPAEPFVLGALLAVAWVARPARRAL